MFIQINAIIYNIIVFMRDQSLHHVEGFMTNRFINIKVDRCTNLEILTSTIIATNSSHYNI